MRRSTLLTGTVLVAILAPTVVALTAAPAHAAPVPERVDEINSSFQYYTTDGVGPYQSVTAQCDPGYKVFGAGGKVIGGAGGVRLLGIIPSSDLRSVTVISRAQQGHTDPWTVVAMAVCALPYDLAPVRVSRTGPATSVRRDCPAETILYGLGFHLESARDNVFVDEVVPDSDLGGLQVGVRGVVGGPIGETLTAYGICAVLEDPGAERISAVSGDIGSPKTAMALGHDGWPAWVYGVGARVDGPGDVFIDALVPGEDLLDARARATVAKALPKAPPPVSRVDGETEDWSLTVYGDNIGSWYGA